MYAVIRVKDEQSECSYALMWVVPREIEPLVPRINRSWDERFSVYIESGGNGNEF